VDEEAVENYVPRRISLSRGYYSSEDEEHITKTTNYLDKLDSNVSSAVRKASFAIYPRRQDCFNLPPNHWGTISNLYEILMFPHDLSPAYFEDSWKEPYIARITCKWNYLIQDYDRILKGESTPDEAMC